MTPGIRPLVAGNWKMNGLKSSMDELRTLQIAEKNGAMGNCDAFVCVPFTILAQAAELISGSSLVIGAQDCHESVSGPHTGDVSAEMIVDCGSRAVIVGHSERRTEHGETDGKICEKAKTALQWGLITIICIGESGRERKDGATLDVLKRQMDGSIPDSAYKGEIVIAYEPVWAIGSGLTPMPDDVEQAHEFMREELVKRFGDMGKTIRLLYGGSVTSTNAPTLTGINNVDGALVGGASLKAEDFLGICAACE